MRLQYVATAALLALAVAGAHAQKGSPPVTDGPLQLRLELHNAGNRDALQVRARLANTGRDALRVLHDANVQPSTLILIDGSGRRVEPFDERTVRRVDMSVSDAMYTTIEPGRDLVLVTARFEKESGTYTIRWGQYLFEGLRSGPWTMRVTFDSAIDWVTADGRSVAAKGRIWKGTLTSQEVQIVLP